MRDKDISERSIADQKHQQNCLFLRPRTNLCLINLTLYIKYYKRQNPKHIRFYDMNT